MLIAWTDSDEKLQRSSHCPEFLDISNKFLSALDYHTPHTPTEYSFLEATAPQAHISLTTCRRSPSRRTLHRSPLRRALDRPLTQGTPQLPCHRDLVMAVAPKAAVTVPPFKVPIKTAKLLVKTLTANTLSMSITDVSPFFCPHKEELRLALKDSSVIL